MVSGSNTNTNRRHLRVSNTHSNSGGHIQKSIQFKYVVYQMGPDMGSNTFVFESI